MLLQKTAPPVRSEYEQLKTCTKRIEEKFTANYIKATMLPFTSGLLLAAGQDTSEGLHREDSCPPAHALPKMLSRDGKGTGKGAGRPVQRLTCPVGPVWMTLMVSPMWPSLAGGLTDGGHGEEEGPFHTAAPGFECPQGWVSNLRQLFGAQP